MSIYEIIAVIFSFVSVILTVRENRLCWPTGIIGIVFFAIVFYKEGLIGNFYLQFLFLSQSLIGIKNWNKSRSKDIYVKWFSDKTFLISATGLSYIMSIIVLDYLGGKMVYLDSLTTILSVIAMFLISYKIIDGWIYWIIADIIYIWIFYNSELYLSSFIYFIFLISSTIGLIKWIRNIKVD